MEVRYSENIDVTYCLTTVYIKVKGYGDESNIKYIKIPETVKDWAEPMKSEMMQFYNERYPLIECAICGKPFNKLRTSLTCSVECSHQLAREKNNKMIECDCSVCGKTFVKRKYQQKYVCSPECSKEYTRLNKGQTQSRRKKKKKSQIGKIEKEARKDGLHYADIQKQKTLEMVGGVKV